MARLLHELLLEQASQHPAAIALVHRHTSLDYAVLARQIEVVGHGLRALNLNRAERVAVYLPKQPETAVALFGVAAGGRRVCPDQSAAET